MSSYPYDPERLGTGAGQPQNPFAFQGSLQEHEPDAPGDGSFRLSSYQLEEFASLGGWMSAFGWIFIVGGVINCLAVFTVLAGNVVALINIVPAVMSFFVGFWCTGGGKSFQSVGRGRGNIVPDLMDGVENVRAVFRLYVVMVLIALALVLAIIALAVVFGAMVGMRR